MMNDLLPEFRSHAGSRRKLVVVAIFGVCMSLLMQGQATASPGGPGSVPPLPTIGEFSSALSRPTANDQFVSSAKQAAFTKMKSEAASGAATALVTSKTLAEPLFQQINESYCGPATIAMAAAYLGVGWAGTLQDKQNAAASLLGAGSDGTAWYGSDNVPGYPKSSWYPMQDALNYLLYKNGKSMWYDVMALPGTPSAAQQIDFRDHLSFDVDHNYPGMDNQYSISGYEIGFQPLGAWQHWWSARGYASNGETTYFNDPAQWSAGRMSSAPTRGGRHTVVVALGGRGYIW